MNKNISYGFYSKIFRKLIRKKCSSVFNVYHNECSHYISCKQLRLNSVPSFSEQIKEYNSKLSGIIRKKQMPRSNIIEVLGVPCVKLIGGNLKSTNLPLIELPQRKSVSQLKPFFNKYKPVYRPNERSHISYNSIPKSSLNKLSRTSIKHQQYHSNVM